MAPVNIPEQANPGGTGAAPQLSPDAGREAPIEAFSGGEGLDKVFQGNANLNIQAISEIEKQKQNKDQMVLGQFDLDLAKAKTDALGQAMTQFRGMNADQAPAFAQQQYEKAVKSIVDTDMNPQVKAALNDHIINHATDLVTTIDKYRTEQLLEWDKTTTDARVENYADEGIQSGGNPKTIAIQEGQIKTTWEDYGKRNGWSDDQIRENQLNSLSIMHGGVVSNFLAQGQYKMAQNYFNENKDDISPARLPGMQNELRQGAITDKAVDIWKNFSAKYRLENGGIDINHINADIMKTPGYTDTERLQIAEKVKGLAYEDIRAKAQQKQDDQESFMDWAVKARQGGVDQATAMAQANKHMSGDPYQDALKTKMLKEVYAPAKESDPQVYMDFKNQLTAGTLDPAQLEKAFLKDDTLSLKDYAALGGKNIKNATKGIDPVEKYTDQAVNKMITTAFPDDPQSQADFHRNLEGQKLTGQAKQDYTAKALGVDKPGNAYSNMKIDWKDDFAKQSAQSKQFAQLNQTVGSDIVSAISRGFSRKATPVDVGNVINALGGPDQFKPGTANYDAVKTLAAKGYPVTEETLTLYKLKYPHGIDQ